MNILFQIAGLIIMSIVFIFYYIDRKYAVKSNKLFLYQAIAIFLSLALDIFSIVTINRPDIFNEFFTKLIAKSYLATVVLVVSLALVYVLGDIENLHPKLFSALCMTTFILLVGFTALIYSLPISVHFDPSGLNDYTEGLPIIMTYVGSFIFMGLTVYIALRYRKEIYEKRVYGVIIFNTLWVLGSAVQGFFNYVVPNLGIVVLTVSLSEALGSLVIYIMLENPSLNIDKVTGALNKRAFKEYVDDAIKRGFNKEILLINYDNEMSKAVLDYNRFPKILVKAISEYPVKVFKNDRNDIIVVSSNKEKKNIIDEIEKFKEKFYLKNNIVTEIPAKVFLFNDLSLYSDANDFIDVMDYLNINQANVEKHVIQITKERVDEVHHKFEVKQKCDKALASRRVVVYFQPIYSNVNLKFTSAEALVRLIDEDGKLIYPNDFIEDMERDGKIVELGKIVFEDVCRFISANNMEKLGLQYIEVNLSTIQCLQENFAQTYIDIAKQYNVNPKYINLEITETGQIAKKILLKNMEMLKEYGFTFSLDDFGTGNSNLNYIVEMPVDIVKFDKTMVNSYFNNEIASYVMNSTINMIKGLGYRIVFEGIETYEQTIVVKNINVEYIQGYYYSKPIDQEKFVEFIKNNNELGQEKLVS
ncbi:MAG: EAL domain-containing protein [Acholeplasmatales bacterium]|nr:EAL domain-containing protein [Acholeplasmatales bacterium]